MKVRRLPYGMELLKEGEERVREGTAGEEVKDLPCTEGIPKMGEEE